MATLQLILNKLHYIAFNLLFVIILPLILLFALSRRIVLDWQNKRVSININERGRDV